VRAIQESDAIYHLRDFTIHEDSHEASHRLADGHNTPRRMPTGHRSQSEADWAYAKRALARGDHPEQIIHRIADYRADEKADPEYYARHTVTKAQTLMCSEIQLFQGKTAPDIQRDEENLKR
jgi:hypothetical protein